MAAPITKLRIGLQPDTPEEHTRLLINVNTEEAQTSLQIATDLRVRANPATAKIYYYNYDGSELLYTETIEPGGNGSWDGEPGRASTAQYEFIFNGWSTEADQTDPTADATLGVYASRRVYAAYKRRDISGFLKIEGIRTLRVNSGTKPWDGVLNISKDAVTWTAWDGTAFAAGDDGVLYLKGEGNTVIARPSSGNWVATLSDGSNHKVSGNAAFLLDSASALDGEDLQMGEYAFTSLFRAWQEFDFEIELPMSSMTKHCYDAMFSDCRKLTKAPKLNSTNLAQYCYRAMFNGCTALTEPPELPATGLYSNCYESMFAGCTSLRVAPELPALSIPTSGYKQMFWGCKSLTEPPALPATFVYNDGYRQMFRASGIRSLPDLPANQLNSGCYAAMFDGCANIKLSETESEEYSIPFRIPSVGSAQYVTGAMTNMFIGTGGTFTGDPYVNTTYYLAAPSGT